VDARDLYFLHTHPDWPWDPSSLLYNGYQGSFPHLTYLILFDLNILITYGKKKETLHYTVFSSVVLTSIFLGSNIFLSTLLSNTLKTLDISKPTNTQPLHVSATHMVIFREVHYEGQIDQNITEVSEPMHTYKILNLKLYDSKYILKIKIQIKNICDRF
jgi:hypothetical protein